MIKIEVDSHEIFMTKLREFFEKAPLYTEYTFEDKSEKGFPGVIIYNIPDSISLKCDICKKETTWNLIHIFPKIQPPAPSPGPSSNGGSYSEEPPGYHEVTFQCALCGKNASTFFFNNPNSNSIKKIGQYPPLSIDLPRRLERILGKDDAKLYKRALICRNFSYGLGALGYIRRVVENKTDLILDNLIKLKRTENDEKKLKQLEQIKKRKSADEKLKNAADYLPTILRPGNQNPLSLLYDNYSKGIHELTEEECLMIFDETRMNFEYILINMEQQLTSAKSYIDSLQKIRKKTNKD